MKSPHLIWAAVVIVFILIGSAVLLILFDKDIAVLLALTGLVAVPVLGAFGVTIKQELSSVHDKVGSMQNTVNGERSELMARITSLQNTVTELALRVPTAVEVTDDLSSSLPVRESFDTGQVRTDAPGASTRQ